MVQCLDLSLNFLRSEKMRSIIAALPPQIRELNLSYNYCEDVSCLASRLSTNFSLVSLNLQENMIIDIRVLAPALTLSAATGSLKYLNLTNNNLDFSTEDKIEAFTALLRQAKNLQVLRLHKMTKLKDTYHDSLISALCESASAKSFRALELDLPT